MDDHTYHADTSRISKSGLDLINITPAHYYQAYFGGQRTDTKTFLFGRAFHARILEPEVYFKDYHNQLSGQDQVKIAKMRKSILSHPSASKLLLGGVNEQVHLWDEPITGAKCKIKCDKVNQNLIIDLKSTRDASPYGFARSCRNYRYDVQSAFYLDGVPDAKQFVFIACEAESARVEVYVAPEKMVQDGRRKYMENLETYVECLKTGFWPAWKSPKIETLPW